MKTQKSRKRVFAVFAFSIHFDFADSGDPVFHYIGQRADGPSDQVLDVAKQGSSESTQQQTWSLLVAADSTETEEAHEAHSSTGSWWR